MAKLSTTVLDEEAIGIVRGEKETWENALVYVTEKVAFRIPDLIRTCEKNYWGVFDSPKDKLTGRTKTWYPLTEEVCNAWADNSDLDTKDVGFRTKPGGNYAITELTRQIVKKYLDETNFGQQLDDSAFRKSIQGTAIWKIIPGKKPKRKLVNRLNFFIDPTAESIQDAYRITERILMFEQDIKTMDWRNTDELKYEAGQSANDPEIMRSTTDSNVMTRDVWEMWGKIPEYLITGNKKDTGEVDGHIVVSGLEAGNPVCHLIEKNTEEDNEGCVIKPYEEDWAMKVPGRWDGRGPAEQVIWLQIWINAIINIRINRSYVSQLGLFKIKRGANITPQSIQRLGSNGAVVVSSMDDIEQMIMQEASQASYEDEKNIRDIAKRITRTLESITGESLPASMPATNASIQASASKNSFVKIKERSGFFVERMLNRHLMPKIVKSTPRGEIIRILNTDTDIEKILDRIAYYYVDKYQDDLEKGGLYLRPDQLEVAIEQAKEKLRNRPEIFIESVEDLVSNLVDATVYVSNEELDMGTTVDKLIMAANLLPEQEREPITRTIYDTLGLPYPKEITYRKQQAQMQQMQQMQQAQLAEPMMQNALQTDELSA